MPRQSNAEEAVMAGDGGRVPDGSEQRAVEAALRPTLNAVSLGDSPGALIERVAQKAIAALDAVHASDPASVLAALLAESPEATVAAIEALLTTDEAVDHTLDEMMQVFVDYGPNFARLNPTDMRLVALRLSRAPCRSLLSKASKEDGDA